MRGKRYREGFEEIRGKKSEFVRDSQNEMAGKKKKKEYHGKDSKESKRGRFSETMDSHWQAKDKCDGESLNAHGSTEKGYRL